MTIVSVFFITILVHGVAVEVSVPFVLYGAPFTFPQVDNRRGLITLQAVGNIFFAVRSDITGAACCPAGGTPFIRKVVLHLVLPIFG